MQPEITWTEERVAKLRELWTQGKTASEIGMALGGVSRNAVIGKVHRLKLSGRPSPIKQRPLEHTPMPMSGTATILASATARANGRWAIRCRRSSTSAASPPPPASPIAANMPRWPISPSA